MNVDDVRAAIKDVREGTLYKTVKASPVLADFADTVLNPPADVAEAMRKRIGYDDSCGPDGPEFDSIIADWITDLITPAAKETT